MSKISGHGGFAVLEKAGGNKRFDVGNYDVDAASMNDDVTDSGSGGVAEGLPILVKVNGVSFDVVDRDDATSPIALGLQEGSVVNLWLKRGASALFHKVTGTIVSNIRESNPQDRARRLSITCEYGSLQRNVTAPTFT